MAFPRQCPRLVSEPVRGADRLDGATPSCLRHVAVEVGGHGDGGVPEDAGDGDERHACVAHRQGGRVPKAVQARARDLGALRDAAERPSKVPRIDGGAGRGRPSGGARMTLRRDPRMNLGPWQWWCPSGRHAVPAQPGGVPEGTVARASGACDRLAQFDDDRVPVPACDLSKPSYEERHHHRCGRQKIRDIDVGMKVAVIRLRDCNRDGADAFEVVDHGEDRPAVCLVVRVRVERRDSIDEEIRGLPL